MSCNLLDMFICQIRMLNNNRSIDKTDFLLGDYHPNVHQRRELDHIQRVHEAQPRKFRFHPFHKQCAMLLLPFACISAFKLMQLDYPFSEMPSLWTCRACRQRNRNSASSVSKRSD